MVFAADDSEDVDTPEDTAICQVDWDGDLKAFFTHANVTRAFEESSRATLEAIKPGIRILKKIKASEALEEVDRIAWEMKDRATNSEYYG